VGAGDPRLQGVVAVDLERGHEKCEPIGGVAHLFGWVDEHLCPVWGPQLTDRVPAHLGVRLVPQRHVAVDELLEVLHGGSVVGVGGHVPSVPAPVTRSDSLEGISTARSVGYH
jgi:hypothetical protein